VLYELRVYEIAPGRMPAIIARFAQTTVHYFRKHGVKPVMYLEPVIGKNNELVYLLEWDSLAERERCWNAFMGDPGWIADRAKTEEDGPIVLSYTSTILRGVPEIIAAFERTGANGAPAQGA
jgi:hypothetical protein